MVNNTNNKFEKDLEGIVFDMIQMGVYKVEDIKKYGFSNEEAKIIQREINKR